MISKTKELKNLFKVIKKFTNYGILDIRSKSRLRSLVFARRIFCVIARTQFGMSYTELGTFIKHNHATIIHNVNKHEADYEYYKEYRELYDRIYFAYLEKCEHPYIILRNILSNRNKVLSDLDLNITKLDTARKTIDKVEEAMKQLKNKLNFNINENGEKKNTKEGIKS
jgi:hypothetical protein